ncbi:MAG: hypothetical protein K2X80_16190 [Pseudomonadaceae bacterium]|nr:hypothetical protein [Pseudomonadaceae bacterium]
MQQQIQQRRDVLDALRQRSNMATADFYRLANRTPPVAPARFKVKPVSKGLFSITDSITGKVKGWRRNHAEACSFADSLTAKVAA